MVRFESSWKNCGQTYKLLCRVCGGLDSVFPETAIVEADMFLINLEENQQRRMLRNLSLAGILHSKQWYKIYRLSFDI